ncbi:MAG TPA: sulfide/dihydroorotate dehydrogenase-like FAD/NAD-binding protein [Clostridia bacterium]|jgi:ferredoxin--NADP+ reductase
MNKILSKRQLAENIIEFVFDAPKVVKHAKPGQFIILRVDEKGERVPFSICDTDKQNGTLTLLIQVLGGSTLKLSKLNAGDSVSDIVGPLGTPSHLDVYSNPILIGGGIGCADVYPQAKMFKSLGKPCDVIIGARNKDLVLYEQEFKSVAKNLYITTDDGSYGKKGFVTDVLKELIEQGNNYDLAFAVGPVPMMKAVCELTKTYNLKTIISMNALMVDGTGMCGCCRVTVGGQIKYACVDGPEFDGHLVDWNEAINRSRTYKNYEYDHLCRLTGEKR